MLPAGSIRFERVKFARRRKAGSIRLKALGSEEFARRTRKLPVDSCGGEYEVRGRGSI